MIQKKVQKVASVGVLEGGKNASAFEFKKCVLSETQVRLGIKRLCV